MDKNNVFSRYHGSLVSLAFNSKDSLGRRFCDDTDLAYNFLDPFFLDREKIRLSKSYRRLADKTQVFPTHLQSNIRNRLIHTNDVVNLSSIFASVLGLNVYLSEAIAYGHDIGHAPFGHLGEKLICQLSRKNFSHNIMSVVTAQKIERKGMGLNLTYETLEGVLTHSRGTGQMKINSNVTEEATLVMYADKIAYTFSDLNDALRVEVLNEKFLPCVVKYFGDNQRERISKISFDFIKESSEEGRISFSKSESAIKFAELRTWMFENVYLVLDKEDYRKKTLASVKKIIKFMDNGYLDPFLAIACMTDSEVLDLSKKLSLKNKNLELNYGFIEIIDNFWGKHIDIFTPDLNKKDFLRENL